MTEGISPEEAQALADKVVESQVIPKKIPPVDDIDGQVKALGGALASALLTATELPLTVMQPVVADLAAQLVALGIRQTEHIDPTAVHAPAWITDGVRQESIKLPEQPQHTESDPHVEMTATAPKCPKRIPKAARAVRR
ncbi:Uncharacterised protein [Mycobacteroides abscessus]|uniref:hypothetical protein n=1 Tax=Mycobacteroides abscessus TaxID=36809 RepID=UPI0005E31799|nr:hypothetical protein [Mycobacteroides abscessus]CPT93038.1 Uncharacterised protein [Mycobacteroides abscessus]CPW96915.1 Uncharacterised protein [Mycobacteroides abscessus]CQA05814.1 Uncharacterised protein [Mycobacteroides abscessus]SKS24856.1 Uncharacterised protein [Mycobacteroides abscessus subsp. bolletii]SKS46070.1 Uncharacterised protein [Mycobacteroides abscessus subsp. bolletii]